MAGEVEFRLHEAEIEEVIDALEAGGLITYTTDYAHHIEFDSFWGSSPPPYPKLRRWVHRKWPDLDEGLLQEAMTYDEEGNEVFPWGSERHKDAVAWIVVKSIQDNGIHGVFYGRRSLEHGKGNAGTIAQRYAGTDDPRASEKVVEDVLDLMFATSQEIIAEEASDTGNLLQSGLVDLLHAPHNPPATAEGEKQGSEGDLSDLPET